jgi:hypothetical protein
MNARRAGQSTLPFYFSVGRVEFLLFGPIFMFVNLVGIVRRMIDRGLFLPMERKIVNVALDSIHPDTASVLRDQLLSVCQIDRNDSTGSSEDILRRFVWLFFRIKPRRLVNSEFADINFCTVTFKVDKTEVTAKLSTLNGLFFDISYSKNVRKFRSSDNISIVSVDIEPRRSSEL